LKPRQQAKLKDSTFTYSSQLNEQDLRLVLVSTFEKQVR